MGSGEETVEIRTVEQIQESAGMRKAQQLQSMQKVQQLRIAGLCCDQKNLVLPGTMSGGDAVSGALCQRRRYLRRRFSQS